MDDGDAIVAPLEGAVGAEGAGDVATSGFDAAFPLPFRVSVLVLLGVWGWAGNVWALNNVYIDMDQVLRYQTGRPLWQSLVSMARSMTVVFVCLYGLFWVSTAGRSDLGIEGVDFAEIFPWAAFLITVSLLAFPIARGFHGTGRQRFQAVLRRVAIGGIDGEHRLPDVLVADALTSYARVLADVVVMLCNLAHGRSSLLEPDRKCGGSGTVAPVLPLLVSGVPFAIRARQCYADYARTRDTTHLWNLAKYMTSFPVLLAGFFLQKEVNVLGYVVGSDALFRVWVLAVLVNSTYSCIWDVTFDWDFELVKRAGRFRHGGLRPVLYFPSRPLYWAVVMANYAMRFTWSLRLSGSWYQFADREFGLFALELVEIARRWMWVFFRVEAEWIRNIKEVPSFPLTERAD